MVICCITRLYNVVVDTVISMYTRLMCIYMCGVTMYSNVFIEGSNGWGVKSKKMCFRTSMLQIIYDSKCRNNIC